MVKMKGKRDCASLLILFLHFCQLLEFGEGQTYCEDKPKILFYRRGQAALVGGPIDDTHGNSSQSHHVVLSNVNKEFLACVSSRNVEWAYIGEGEPSKFQESSTVDIQKYEDGSISYCLTSQITFYNKQSDTELSRHTGRYICREIGNATNVASVYVFATKKNSPTFLHSRKTLTLSLSRENITMVPVRLQKPAESSINSNSSSSETNRRDDDVNSRNVHSGTTSTTQTQSNNTTTLSMWAFTIPCVTTRPNVPIKLLKKGKSGIFMAFKGAFHEFDAKFGFRVNASNPEDLSSFYGDYKCVSKSSGVSSGRASGESSGKSSGNIEDFVLISLVKAKSLQLYPPTTEVFTSGMLNLTCESEDPVIMKEILPHASHDLYSYLDEDEYGHDRSDDIVETTEKTEQKTHIANYMEIAPAPGRSGEIQCLREKDSAVLHTWRYKIIRKRADKLSGIKFNKRENSFTCKSKSGSPGRLSFVSCRTPSECRINRICLTKSENCRGYSNSTRAFCERKTHFCGKIFYKGGSGLIRCVGEGIDEIRGFTDEASGDEIVRMGFGKLKASETALFKLAGIVRNDQGQTTSGSVIDNATISEGNAVNVTLKMGYYYFLYPVQWAVKFRNGSTSQINPGSQFLKVEKLTRTVSASLTLPYTSATTFSDADHSGSENSTDAVGEKSNAKPSEIVALNALIPLRSSVDPSWKTITLPLTVFGRVGMVQRPISDSDGESEEVVAVAELPLKSKNEKTSNPGNNTAVSASIMSDSIGTEDDESEDENDDDVDDIVQEDENEQQQGEVIASFNTSLSLPSNGTGTHPDEQNLSNVTDTIDKADKTAPAERVAGKLQSGTILNIDSDGNSTDKEKTGEEISGDEIFLARSDIEEENQNGEVKVEASVTETTQLPYPDNDDDDDMNTESVIKLRSDSVSEIETTTTNAIEN